MSFWLWPLPPPGPLTWVGQWPDRNLSESVVEVDATILEAAASEAEQLWEVDPNEARPTTVGCEFKFVSSGRFCHAWCERARGPQEGTRISRPDRFVPSINTDDAGRIHQSQCSDGAAGDRIAGNGPWPSTSMCCGAVIATQSMGRMARISISVVAHPATADDQAYPLSSAVKDWDFCVGATKKMPQL